MKKDGPNVEIDVYSFMTTAPNALTDSINHERMPVLLSEEEEFETWLASEPAWPSLIRQMRSCSPDLRRSCRHSTAVGTIGCRGGAGETDLART